MSQNFNMFVSGSVDGSEEWTFKDFVFRLSPKVSNHFLDGWLSTGGLHAQRLVRASVTVSSGKETINEVADAMTSTVRSEKKA